MLGDMNDTGTCLLLKNMNILIENYPEAAPNFLEDILIKVLGLMFDSNENLTCKKEYHSLLITLILSNSSYFIQLCRNLNQKHQTDIIPQFLDYTFELVCI